MDSMMQFNKSVTTRYPYPLAKHASDFNHASNPEDRFHILESFVEMTVRYLGVISLTNYLRGGWRVPRIQILLSRLASPEVDVWLDLLNSIVPYYHDRPDEFVMPELLATYQARLGQDSKIYETYQILAAQVGLSQRILSRPPFIALDDFLSLLIANRRAGWPDPDKTGTAESTLLPVLFPALVEMCDRLAFLTQYPLGYIANVSREIDGYSLDIFMGEANIPKQVDIPRLEDAYIETQQVYLCNADMRPILGLQPLIIAVEKALYILFQNQNNERIFYIHCGTHQPYTPDAPGYTLGGVTVGGSISGTPEQRPLPASSLAPVSPLEVNGETPIAELGSRSILESNTGLSKLFRLTPRATNRIEPPGTWDKVASYEAKPAIEPTESSIISSRYWLEFQSRAYTADQEEAPQRLREGATLGPYRIIGKIGEGPVAEVYKAKFIRSLIPNHTVVLRVIKQRFVAETLRQEVEPGSHGWWLLSQQRHSSVLALSMIRPVGERLILEMEYFEGVSLRHLLNKESGVGLPIPEALHIAVQVCHALAAAHNIGLVHGHLKPSNILVSRERRPIVKVTDFGAYESATLSSNKEDGSSGITIDTLLYLAPEIIIDESVPTPGTDVYSVGILLYQLFTGRRPFPDESLAESKERIKRQEYGPVPIHGIVPGFPLELERLVQKAMQPDPNKRYQHIETLLHDLEAIARSFDAVNAISRILLENIREKDITRFTDFLDDQRIVGPDLKSRVMQYCLLEERLEQILDTWFGLPQLLDILEKKSLKATPRSKEQCIAQLLENECVHVQSKPEGLPQSIARVQEWLHLVNAARTPIEVDGLIVSAARECEAILQNLIRFHAVFLFQDGWKQMLRQSVLKQQSKLMREDLTHLSSGALLEILDRFNDFVSSDSYEATLFQRVFTTRSILSFDQSYKKVIPSSRNERVHVSEGMTSKSIVELRGFGFRLIRTILSLLRQLEQARTYPQVIVVQETCIDHYGRHPAKCLSDEGIIRAVYTSLNLQPGQFYFLYSRSEPISVDPIIVPYV